MSAEIVNKLVALAKEIAAIEKETHLCGIEGERVHVNSDEYKVLFPDYRDHSYSKHGGYIRVSHEHDGVEFFALITPSVKGDLRELI